MDQDNNNLESQESRNMQGTNLPQDIGARIRDMREKKMREQAASTIKKEIPKRVSPFGSIMMHSSMQKEDSATGKDYIDTLQNASSEEEGLQKIAVKIKIKETLLKFGVYILGFFIILLFLIVLVSSVFKNADTQIYSNENFGKVDDEIGEGSVFSKYPSLYPKIESAVNKVRNRYKIEVDKYLILATLLAPIDNGMVQPNGRDDCGATECYSLDDKSYTWDNFLEAWGDKAEFLARAQILTYLADGSVSCGSAKTMEQYAKNDASVNEFNVWKLFNPVNWFRGFRSITDAEVNAKCVEAPKGTSSIPTVRVLSNEQGIYHNTIDGEHNRGFEKEEDSGGVYFWNLVNDGGFIHVYLKDYLSVDEESGTNDQNYEQNLPEILDLAEYIYSYYESIRKDCYGMQLLESNIETIKVSDKDTGEIIEVDFEEYLGGVLAAEFSSGNHEALKAFAILTRSYALSIVGLDGEGVIENSSNNQNYNPNYRPADGDHIWEAVKDTKGLVVTNFDSLQVKMTEYDAFCPTKSTTDNGFYYLSTGQRSLPINPGAYQQKSGKSFSISPVYLECPCFRSLEDRPHDKMVGRDPVRFTQNPYNPPIHGGGVPYQTTTPLCWIEKPSANRSVNGINEYAWRYKASGGHGRGASQYGLKYFGEFDYDYVALIKLFYGDNVTLRKLTYSLEEGECQNAEYATGGGSTSIDSCGVEFEVTDSNYTTYIGSSPLNEPLVQALEKNGYDIDCLNSCIGQRVNAAGYGTREGVVEAGVGLLECSIAMTGHTYPYDHRGAWVGRSEMNGRLGVSSEWGIYFDWATGCQPEGANCRAGINCANFVRWSFCNGGMNSCSTGSTFATGQTGFNSNEDYYPGAIRVLMTGRSVTVSPNIKVSELPESYRMQISYKYSGETRLSSVSQDDFISLLQPGDGLYSDKNGRDNHAMLIVGTNDSEIWIAENGRKTGRVRHTELKSGNKSYGLLLLDGYYERTGNMNNLGW